MLLKTLEAKMYEDVQKILIDKETIAKRVAELGKQISKDYEGLDPILVCTLRGAVIFFADLIMEITIPLNIDFIATSSYGEGVRTSGVVRLVKDLKENIEGRHLIIVEDIIDSGLTMHYLKNYLQQGFRNLLRFALFWIK
jgi:hypoxanthine phosphoribosyltransferase